MFQIKTSFLAQGRRDAENDSKKKGWGKVRVL